MVIEETVDISDPNLMSETAEDSAAHDEHDIECSRCHREYLIDTYNGYGGISASLANGEDVDVGLDYSDEVYGFDEWEPAKDPLTEYEKAVAGLHALLGQGRADAGGIFHRMIFTQFIATMEAYLTDRLLLLCATYPEIEQRVVEKATIFKEVKIPLAEAIIDAEAPKRRFRATLQAFLYHDVERMEALYRIAVSGPVMPSDDVRERLKAAVSRRHDCVHRNGFTKDGQLNEIGHDVIQDTATAIEALVRQIETSADRTVLAIEAARPI